MRFHDEISVQLRQAHDLVGQLSEVLSGTPHLNTMAVHGEETIAQVYSLHCGDAREEIRECFRPPFVFDRLRRSEGTVSEKAPIRGVRRRNLVDPDVPALPGGPGVRAQIDIQPGVEQRLHARLPYSMIIVDEQCALIGLPTGDAITDALLVSPSVLLDVLCATFESLWRVSLPMGGEGDAHDLSVADDRVLLKLLAAGATDDVLSRRTHLSTRTVQRRVSRIMEQLSASTRFQAGTIAAKQGLI